MSSIRVILWPSTMAYSGFLLSGQGLRTFNNLSMTEACLGALTGFLLAIMFTLREKRHQRGAFVAHSIVEFLPHLRGLVPKRNRYDQWLAKNPDCTRDPSGEAGGSMREIAR